MESHTECQSSMAIIPVRKIQVKSKAASQLCRICLDEDFSSQLLYPCVCCGTSKYVHTHCLIQWITRQEHNHIKRIHCQICNTKLNYKLYHKNQLLLSKLVQNWAKNKWEYVAMSFLFFFLILVILAIGILFEMAQQQSDSPFAKVVLNSSVEIGFISVAILVFMTVIVLVVLFLSEYGVKTTLLIKDIENYGEQHGPVGKIHCGRKK